MADSLSSSSCADTEGHSSASSLSLSVGYYPSEDTFAYENTVSHEDTFAEGPSIHSVPPFQGSWRTDTGGRLLERQDHIQDDPEQFCKLSITLACDTDMSSNHSDSVISWGLHGDSLWINKYPKEKTQLTLSKLNGLVQKLEQFLENQRDDKDDKSVFPEPAQKEDMQLSSSTSPHMAQTISQTSGRQRTGTAETSSSSSDQLEEEDSHASTQALSCLNFRWAFRWLRQQVLSFWGRQHPQKATEDPGQPTQKKRLSHRNKRIQPQESIELEHPVLPDFKTC
ncbi:hypothetical protein HJG60_001664 [Phyllostomus discolor]|uniref:Uncharacterized protein C12orf71 homolog n=1 Tax=Phyllostomus discolor TaxID=89673 RepID=A0A7E6D761_9CHIR|nr:uncharacterized protein C12orf71 homolog [Phyllostomus discolor]KAF6117665.1 hypothetical protein HJG60_001664 [Phyllostomus discolor]